VKDTHLFAAATNLFNASYSDGSAANASAIAVAPPRMIAAGLRSRF
jgi:outer membrane receptor protein involved in Fe transport